MEHSLVLLDHMLPPMPLPPPEVNRSLRPTFQPDSNETGIYRARPTPRSPHCRNLSLGSLGGRCQNRELMCQGTNVYKAWLGTHRWA